MQHGRPSPPQNWVQVPAPGPPQRRELSLQVRPSQQGAPLVPQGWQAPSTQLLPAAQLPSGQHAWPTPPQTRHCLVRGWKPGKQRRPSSQVSPLQQVMLSPPHGTHWAASPWPTQVWPSPQLSPLQHGMWVPGPQPPHRPTVEARQPG
ncbi:MAG TPA: hypothetical protein VGE98_16285 [Thermoanaerobaculia bacterium]